MIKKTHLNNLFKLQTKCIRLITNANKNVHTNDLCKRLNILKLLEDLIEIDICKLSYK